MGTTTQFQTTTVRLPKELWEKTRTAVKQARVASSINDFLVAALEDKLRQLKEMEIDRAFENMGADEQYQRDAIELSRSFERSDWQAYKAANSKTKHEPSRKKVPSKTSPR